MYRLILVGYDGRPSGPDALALAHGLAAIEGAELVLCVALELDPLATPAHAYERAMAEAEERLTAQARELLGETPFRIRMIGGVSAPRALHEVAEDDRCRRDRARLDRPRRPRPGAARQRRRAPPARRAVRRA